MYYDLGKSQAQIAESLGVSKMTVSRMLDRARQMGIVNITVNVPVATDEAIAAALQQRYRLRHAIVLQLHHSANRLDDLARGCAMYLDTIIGENDIVGIAAGRTVARILPHLTLPALHGARAAAVVQLTGGFPNPSPYNPTSILHDFAARFLVDGYFFHRPLYAPSVAVANAFRMHIGDDPIFDMWNRCNIVITGAGFTGSNSIYRRENVITEVEMNRLIEKGAVGDLFGRWFDTNGKDVDDEVNDRVQAVVPDQLKGAARVVVGVGDERLPALRSLLRVGYPNVLITDDKTAAQLLL